jgi:hypothetical protein
MYRIVTFVTKKEELVRHLPLLPLKFMKINYYKKTSTQMYALF